MYDWHKYKLEDCIRSDNNMEELLRDVQESREVMLESAFDTYLYKVHGSSLQYLLHLQSTVHNMKLKHFQVVNYQQVSKTCYLFKGELIFTIYFDNMQWKCDTYY